MVFEMDHLAQARVRRNQRDAFVRVPKPWYAFWAPKYPVLKQGTVVRIKRKPEKIREVLQAEWHFQRKEWVYIVESSTPHEFGYEPKFAMRELEQIRQRTS